MRQMKESGIVFLGEIPSNWRVTPAKHVLVKKACPVQPDDEVVICSNKGKIVLRGETNPGLVSMTEAGYQGVSPGDLLIHGMDTWHGAIAVSKLKGKCTGVVHVCESREDKRFIAYYLQSLAFRNVYKAFSNGVRQNTSDFRSWSKTGEIPVVLPSRSEQVQLADYLDVKCSEIEKAISSAEASVAEYEQYKKSIIFEAVKKGLDASAPMKDNRIDWAHSVPNFWKTFRFKQLYSLFSETGHPEEELLSVYLDKGVIRYAESDGMQVHKPSESLDRYQLVKPGNLVLNNQQAWRGSVGVSRHRGIVSPAYKVFEPKPEAPLEMRYMNYLFRYVMVPSFDVCSRGVGTIQRSIAMSVFWNDAELVLPSVFEQDRISDYLDEKCAHIANIIASKLGVIEELKAYKKSLIYEIVTGKRGIK